MNYGESAYITQAVHKFSRCFLKKITKPGKDFYDASRDKSHVWFSQLTQSVKSHSLLEILTYEQHFDTSEVQFIRVDIKRTKR